MTDHNRRDLQFDATTARLLRREALRRAAHEINTTSGPGLENVLAQISAEITAEAVALRATLPRNADELTAIACAVLPAPQPRPEK
jgi:hypothetical protein